MVKGLSAEHTLNLGTIKLQNRVSGSAKRNVLIGFAERINQQLHKNGFEKFRGEDSCEGENPRFRHCDIRI
jgi:hypothetical protein